MGRRSYAKYVPFKRSREAITPTNEPYQRMLQWTEWLTDSTINQLLFLINEIHAAFDDPKALEVRAVFLDISKAFDKVWHEVLIF